jgi:hypothetical protein
MTQGTPKAAEQPKPSWCWCAYIIAPATQAKTLLKESQTPTDDAVSITVNSKTCNRETFADMACVTAGHTSQGPCGQPFKLSAKAHIIQPSLDTGTDCLTCWLGQNAGVAAQNTAGWDKTLALQPNTLLVGTKRWRCSPTHCWLGQNAGAAAQHTAGWDKTLALQPNTQSVYTPETVVWNCCIRQECSLKGLTRHT